MEEPNYRYKRLVETQKRGGAVDAKSLRATVKKSKEKDDKGDGEDDEKKDFETELEEEEKNSFSAKRAFLMASPDIPYLLVGAIGSIVAGGVFPAWGFLFAETIELLFQRVY